MAGMSLNMGLGSSVFANGYPGAATPLAAAPTPQGNTSVGQKAFGIVTVCPSRDIQSVMA